MNGKKIVKKDCRFHGDFVNAYDHVSICCFCGG